jgi:hypothetical protein
MVVKKFVSWPAKGVLDLKDWRKHENWLEHVVNCLFVLSHEDVASFCSHLVFEQPASLADGNSEGLTPKSWSCLSVQWTHVVHVNWLAKNHKMLASFVLHSDVVQFLASIERGSHSPRANNERIEPA